MYIVVHECTINIYLIQTPFFKREVNE